MSQQFQTIGRCGPAKYFKAATVQATRYPADKSIALVANAGTEHQQIYTVCLAGSPGPGDNLAPIEPGHVWLKGWSENEGVPEALVEVGLVELTGNVWPTGYTYAEEAKLLVEVTI